jgi:hypothetical protein
VLRGDSADMAAAIDKDTAALQANNGRRKELEKEIDIIIHEINFYKDGYRVRRGGRASWLLSAATHCCRAGELTAVLTTACCITTCYILPTHYTTSLCMPIYCCRRRSASPRSPGATRSGPRPCGLRTTETTR